MKNYFIDNKEDKKKESQKSIEEQEVLNKKKNQ